ncbi:hypothetical protein C8J57DRAFT_1646576 [Mycena rebaudengoi]|nr:hypothetical protein C8J57DRAFT_1646576 [Mycena rebaudengoi]
MAFPSTTYRPEWLNDAWTYAFPNFPKHSTCMAKREPLEKSNPPQYRLKVPIRRRINRSPLAPVPQPIVHSLTFGNDLISANSPQASHKRKTPPCTARCAHSACPWSYSRKAELLRHILTHMSPAEKAKHMYYCPYEGCEHKTLQKSNMVTHTRIHSGEKPYICLEHIDSALCSFRTGDPASLTRHRASTHAGTPRDDVLKKRSSPRVYPYTRRRASSSSSTTTSSAHRSDLSIDSPSSSSTCTPSHYSDTYPAYSATSYLGLSPVYCELSFAPGAVSWDSASLNLDTLVESCAMQMPLVPPTAHPGPALLFPSENLASFAANSHSCTLRYSQSPSSIDTAGWLYPSPSMSEPTFTYPDSDHLVHADSSYVSTADSQFCFNLSQSSIFCADFVPSFECE